MRIPATGASLRRAFPVVLVLALMATVLAFLASTFFGHARSPYDMCTGPDGREVSCSVLARETSTNPGG